jgi:hypothetical protein
LSCTNSWDIAAGPIVGTVADLSPSVSLNICGGREVFDPDFANAIKDEKGIRVFPFGSLSEIWVSTGKKVI